MNLQYFKNYVLPIFLAILFASIGHIIVMILAKYLGFEFTKVERGIITFLTTSFLALWLFPSVFKIPFGKQKPLEWLGKLGLYIPKNFSAHILLGIVLGLVSLTGMLLGSLVTGKYVFNIENLSLGHFLFSLTPGIWEEVLYRGVIMMVLLNLYKDIKKAFWWQAFIFAIVHFQSPQIWGLLELVSVFIIGSTFMLSAVRTRSLIVGIIYHYIHDAFIYLVQIPGGEYHGFEDKFAFYVFLWTAMLVNVLIIEVATKLLGVQGERRIYNLNNINDDFKLFKRKDYKSISKVERICFMLFVFTGLLFVWENKHMGFNLVIVLTVACVLINLTLFILSLKKVKSLFFLTFFFNAIISFISGYQTHLQGSQKAYLFFYLNGGMFILLTLYFLSMHKFTNSEIETNNE